MGMGETCISLLFLAKTVFVKSTRFCLAAALVLSLQQGLSWCAEYFKQTHCRSDSTTAAARQLMVCASSQHHVWHFDAPAVPSPF
jgi:hypothetical protein